MFTKFIGIQGVLDRTFSLINLSESTSTTSLNDLKKKLSGMGKVDVTSDGSFLTIKTADVSKDDMQKIKETVDKFNSQYNNQLSVNYMPTLTSAILTSDMIKKLINTDGLKKVKNIELLTSFDLLKSFNSDGKDGLSLLTDAYYTQS